MYPSAVSRVLGSAPEGAGCSVAIDSSCALETFSQSAIHEGGGAARRAVSCLRCIHRCCDCFNGSVGPLEPRKRKACAFKTVRAQVGHYSRLCLYILPRVTVTDLQHCHSAIGKFHPVCRARVAAEKALMRTQWRHKPLGEQVSELGRAVHAFAYCGLSRHADRACARLITTVEPCTGSYRGSVTI